PPCFLSDSTFRLISAFSTPRVPLGFSIQTTRPGGPSVEPQPSNAVGLRAPVAPTWEPHCLGIIYLLPCEVVPPIPVVICCVRTRRAIDTGMEPDEGPGPLRKRAQREPGHQVERAMADRPVAVPGVENDITVL